MNNLLTPRQTSRAVIGAITGAVVALIWIVFDVNAVLIFGGLTLVGATVGTVLDRPQRLIQLLERLQER